MDTSSMSEEVAINVAIPKEEEYNENISTSKLDSINLYFKLLDSGDEREEIARREILFLNKNNVKLFEDIQKWINKNDQTTLEETIEYQLMKMIGQDHRSKTTIGHQLLNNPKSRKVDAIAKTFFTDHLPDFILKYPVDDDKEKQKKRYNFIKLLLHVGLVVEEETKSDDNGKRIKYVKIFAPFKLLCHCAQHMKLKFPLELENHKIEHKTRPIKWFLPNLTYNTLNLNKVSAPFRSKYLEKFKGGNEKDSFLKFFSSARRNLLVDYIMNVANHTIFTFNENEDKDAENNPDVVTKNMKRISNEFAMSTLLKEKIFTDYYPLHDGSVICEDNNLRAQLNDSWIKNGKNKPLDKIREYFGEKLALYFVFLKFYTNWLTIPSIVGVIVFIYGLIDAFSRGLVSSKNIGSVSSIVDNALTVPFALFMTLWSTMFLEYWKGANCTLQYNWDVTDYEEEELPRPEFYGTVRRISPITGKEEVFFPLKEKLKKFIISGIIITVSAGVLLIFPKVWIHIGIYTSVTTAVVSLIVMLTLRMLYSNLALRLTDFENHRTQTAYEDSLILKIFLFDFVNFYTALLYVILLKQQFVKDLINSPDVTTGCEYDNCFTELTVQLAIIMIGKQAFGQISEVLIPFVKSRLNKDTIKQVLGEDEEIPQWVDDDHLDVPPPIEDSEYIEIVIQFGFISLFCTVFPLAPLFAWINNIVESRSDAFKYINAMRRPVGCQAQDIGMWEKSLTFLSIFGVLSNTIIIAFYSSWLKAQFLKYIDDDDTHLLIVRLLFIIAFEHFVYIIKVVAYFIPNESESLKEAIAREKYLANKILKNKEMHLVFEKEHTEL
ncbi:calcium-activated chloride channel-domain-containing protein [Gigaspora rosea]|uniref:Calcium-activated chloride channel-domain-containing protein n=1 Tax=Gigaspora rosea TaxID=44941 RepID=A0A397UGU6_9GLOM|nr:calcium-activated chloride channel-domain-containing protein [Gigaspora rosea]